MAANRAPSASLPALDLYRKKRSFAHTPEPAGDEAVAVGRRFVIQKHWATRTHFDFRLEHEGVLKSWAVPKGPSLDPKTKRMAVATEDHPLAYADFSGVIPAGHYGAGRVVVWDRGHWEPIGDAEAGLEKGELKFALHGERLQGRWVLVRLKHDRNGNAAKPTWLLIKERDDHVRAADDFDPVAVWEDGLPPATSKRALPALPTPARHQPAAMARRTPTIALPPTLKPMLATPQAEPPRDEADWAFELKFDGYRLLVHTDGHGGARCLTRNGQDWTALLPDIAAAVVRAVPPHSWIDGELIALHDDGTPDFDALQARLALTTRHGRLRPSGVQPDTAALRYAVFDAPFLGGADLRGEPWTQRREQLVEAFHPKAADADRLQLSEVFDAPLAQLATAAEGLGLEGLIGKRRASLYGAQRNGDWIKLKTAKRQEFVVVGHTAGRGTRDDPGALALAEPAADGLWRYVGNVGSGMSATQRAELREWLSKNPSDTPTAVIDGEPPRAVRWVEPTLVVEIAYGAWTAQRRLRHAVFRGVRRDKRPGDVSLDGRDEVGGLNMSSTSAPQAARRAGKAGSNRSAQTDPTPPPGTLRVTHPERRIDAASGATKGEVVDYHARVGSLMLEHLRGRPVALLRAPQGVGGPLFFQKHVEGDAIAGVTLLDPAFDPGHAALIEIARLPALLNAAQMNTLEFHTWNARKDRIDQPDRIVLDLDPGEGVGWPAVREAAQLARALIGELGLAAFLKTSGGKGLHVVVPIRRQLGWDEVKAASKAMSEHLARVFPERFVALSGPKRRVGRIYVDYLRNGRGATTVAAWSLRARPGLGVSVPVAWDELGSIDSGAHWTLANIDGRLMQGNAPWDDMASAAKDLRPAVRRLQSASDRRPSRLG